MFSLFHETNICFEKSNEAKSHYLLNEPQDELVNKFLWAQINTPLKSDWVHLIIKDLKTLEIRLTLMKRVIKKGIQNHSK